MTYSCVTEAYPRFLRQLHVWVTTLLELGGARPSDLVVHVVEGDPTGAAGRYLAARGIAWTVVPRFGDGRCCNKLRQVLSEPLRERGGAVALCDADLAFSGPIARFAGRGRAAAKPVDHPNPPLAVLAELYRRAGFDRLPDEIVPSHAGEPTFANNCNGGLYLLQRDLLDALGPRWAHWTRWALEQQPFLGRWVAYADQLGFGLATWELGEPVALLEPAANFPLHLPAEAYDPAGEPPVVLHFHDRLGEDGRLIPTGVPAVDERVRLVNATLAAHAASAP